MTDDFGHGGWIAVAKRLYALSTLMHSLGAPSIQIESWDGTRVPITSGSCCPLGALNRGWSRLPGDLQSRQAGAGKNVHSPSRIWRTNYTYDLPRVLGMDEKVLGGKPRFVVGDVENRKLLDILMSRKQADLEAYFGTFDFMDRAKVEVITQDMYWPYKQLNERFFRRATIVVDRFHVTRYADFAVSTVRKSVQASLDNEGRIAMKSKIGLLQARPERLDDDGKWELKRIFRQHPVIETAVTVKEWFYDIYNCETRAEAEKAYEAWVELLPPEMEKPFKPILSYMREKRWRRFIFNFFDHRYTNGYVEGVNSLLDEISRAGRGYDLATLRAKALLRFGNVKPLTDEVAFDLMSVGFAEREQILSTTVGHGVDLSTFERELREGSFW